jgi:mRNA interferase MazF
LKKINKHDRGHHLDYDREYTRELVAARARKHRDALRRAGLRPVQIWVADDRRAGFPAECRRQCLLVREMVARRRRWIKLRRGDLVALEGGGRQHGGRQHGGRQRSALQRAGLGAPGPPQLALVIQTEWFEAHSQLAVLPLTSELRAAPLLRVTLAPSEQNMLLVPSQVMIDRLRMIPRRRIRMVFGQLDESALLAVDRALAVFLGIGLG